MNLNSIPAFDDNYIWVLNDEAGRCLIVGSRGRRASIKRHFRQ